MYAAVLAAGHASLVVRAGGKPVASDNRWILRRQAERGPVSLVIQPLEWLAILPISIQQSYADTSAELQAQTFFKPLVFKHGLCHGCFQRIILLLQTSDFVRAGISLRVSG